MFAPTTYSPVTYVPMNPGNYENVIRFYHQYIEETTQGKMAPAIRQNLLSKLVNIQTKAFTELGQCLNNGVVFAKTCQTVMDSISREWSCAQQANKKFDSNQNKQAGSLLRSIDQLQKEVIFPDAKSFRGCIAAHLPAVDHKTMQGAAAYVTARLANVIVSSQDLEGYIKSQAQEVSKDVFPSSSQPTDRQAIFALAVEEAIRACSGHSSKKPSTENRGDKDKKIPWGILAGSAMF